MKKIVDDKIMMMVGELAFSSEKKACNQGHYQQYKNMRKWRIKIACDIIVILTKIFLLIDEQEQEFLWRNY